MKTIEVVVKDSKPLVMAFDDDGSKVFVEGRGVNGWADVDSIPLVQRKTIKNAYVKLNALQSELFDTLAVVPFREIEIPS